MEQIVPWVLLRTRAFLHDFAQESLFAGRSWLRLRGRELIKPNGVSGLSEEQWSDCAALLRPGLVENDAGNDGPTDPRPA